MKIAYFDFDGTIITRDSGVICAIPCIRRGLLGAGIGSRLIATYLASLVGLRRRTDAQLIGFECYGGKTLEELRQVMQELHDRHLRAYISTPIRRRIDEHRRAGDRLVILTASAFFFAEPTVRELGFDDLVGTNVAFGGDQRCTGRVDGEIVEGPVKRDVGVADAKAHGVPLADCSFYSDHIVDLPLLEAVGTPVAVGPNRPLARVARARRWQVIEHS